MSKMIFGPHVDEYLIETLVPTLKLCKTHTGVPAEGVSVTRPRFHVFKITNPFILGEPSAPLVIIAQILSSWRQEFSPILGEKDWICFALSERAHRCQGFRDSYFLIFLSGLWLADNYHTPIFQHSLNWHTKRLVIVSSGKHGFASSYLFFPFATAFERDVRPTSFSERQPDLHSFILCASACENFLWGDIGFIEPILTPGVFNLISGEFCATYFSASPAAVFYALICQTPNAIPFFGVCADGRLFYFGFTLGESKCTFVEPEHLSIGDWRFSARILSRTSKYVQIAKTLSMYQSPEKHRYEMKVARPWGIIRHHTQTITLQAPNRSEITRELLHLSEEEEAENKLFDAADCRWWRRTEYENPSANSLRHESARLLLSAHDIHNQLVAYCIALHSLLLPELILRQILTVAMPWFLALSDFEMVSLIKHVNESVALLHSVEEHAGKKRKQQ